MNQMCYASENMLSNILSQSCVLSYQKPSEIIRVSGFLLAACGCVCVCGCLCLLSASVVYEHTFGFEHLENIAYIAPFRSVRVYQCLILQRAFAFLPVVVEAAAALAFVPRK